MKFSVRVYADDGSSKGESTIDSSIDTLDGKPVRSLDMAKTYANRFLKSKADYAFVDRIRTTND